MFVNKKPGKYRTRVGSCIAIHFFLGRLSRVWRRSPKMPLGLWYRQREALLPAQWASFDTDANNTRLTRWIWNPYIRVRPRGHRRQSFRLSRGHVWHKTVKVQRMFRIFRIFTSARRWTFVHYENCDYDLLYTFVYVISYYYIIWMKQVIIIRR